MQVYERLGTDKPHRTEESVAGKAKPENATCLLSRAGAEERKTQPTIDFRSKETLDDSYAKNDVHETPRKTETSTLEPTPSRSITITSVKISVKKGRKKEISNSRPYIGLFEASLELQDGPTTWRINDLRENVTGDDKTWAEKALCLLCGAGID
ncbi:hypothetical protein FCIRC_8866 [Fusarium circinatum]|uniref:Uncharacterized protein n=1 Tax=Fusarium circinatum TaxID=48490 RepID=A0A8H5TK07_FUSCI|nr:hypothetical protein FCIRC_8866 [Fusarium circinatum]